MLVVLLLVLILHCSYLCYHSDGVDDGCCCTLVVLVVVEGMRKSCGLDHGGIRCYC